MPLSRPKTFPTYKFNSPQNLFLKPLTNPRFCLLIVFKPLNTLKQMNAFIGFVGRKSDLRTRVLKLRHPTKAAQTFGACQYCPIIYAKLPFSLFGEIIISLVG